MNNRSEKVTGSGDLEFALQFCIINNSHKTELFDALKTTNKELINDCVKDSQENILPIIALFNKSPQFLKSYLGKSTWKRLCKITAQENKKLCSLVMRKQQSVDFGMSNKEKSEYLKKILSLNPCTSEIIYRANNLKDLSLSKINKIDEYAKRNVKEVEPNIIFMHSNDVQQKYDQLKDTERMCRQSGIEFNINMKWPEMIALHTQLSEATDARNLNIPLDAEFKLAKYIQKEIDKNKDLLDGVKVTVLKSVKDFVHEKAQMKHCILSYCKRTYNNDYIACHFEFEDTHSTAGYHANKKSQTVSLNNIKEKTTYNSCNSDQHYGYRDSIVKCEKLLTTERIVRNLIRDAVRGKSFDF